MCQWGRTCHGAHMRGCSPQLAQKKKWNHFGMRRGAETVRLYVCMHVCNRQITLTEFECKGQQFYPKINSDTKTGLNQKTNKNLDLLYAPITQVLKQSHPSYCRETIQAWLNLLPLPDQKDKPTQTPRASSRKLSVRSWNLSSKVCIKLHWNLRLQMCSLSVY